MDDGSIICQGYGFLWFCTVDSTEAACKGLWIAWELMKENRIVVDCIHLKTTSEQIISEVKNAYRAPCHVKSLCNRIQHLLGGTRYNVTLASASQITSMSYLTNHALDTAKDWNSLEPQNTEDE